MYDLIFITQIPAFYKVNLYNEIAKRSKVLVVFIGDSSVERSQNFIGQEMSFDVHFLNRGNFEEVSQIKTSIKLVRLLMKVKYKKIVISGWNLLPFWIACFYSKKMTNCLALESSVEDSQTDGLKGWVKKQFLKRITLVYASGNLHLDLLKALNYKKKIIVTRGVGLINKSSSSNPEKEKHYEKKFLFIGRLVEVKNILKLVDLFEELSDFQLTVIGDGPLYSKLTSKVYSNITFIKHVDNKMLFKLLNRVNFLILPSLSEPWGLVVEESLSCRTPVIVSKESGSSELIENGKNGYLFNAGDLKELKEILLSIKSDKYLEIRRSIPSDLIANKDVKQVQAYIGEP